MSNQPTPYEQWPAESHRRWVKAGNTFGLHLMKAARDYAFERIPETASPEARELAQKAAADALYGVMQLLDGVADSSLDHAYDMEYVLKARVRDCTSQQVVEEFELAPDGDGLCMGFHGWVEGDFGE